MHFKFVLNSQPQLPAPLQTVTTQKTLCASSLLLNSHHQVRPEAPEQGPLDGEATQERTFPRFGRRHQARHLRHPCKVE